MTDSIVMFLNFFVKHILDINTTRQTFKENENNFIILTRLLQNEATEREHVRFGFAL